MHKALRQTEVMDKTSTRLTVRQLRILKEVSSLVHNNSYEPSKPDFVPKLKKYTQDTTTMTMVKI